MAIGDEDGLRADWRAALHDAMTELRRLQSAPRLAVVGVGNELCGDDAAGVLVAREILAEIGRCDACLVLEAGPMPESFGGPLRAFQPGLVLLVDAVDMGATPGAVAWIDWRCVDGFSASTHALPLSVVADYYRATLACRVGLIGVQVGDLTLGGEVTPSVNHAIHAVVAALVGESASLAAGASR